MAIALFTTNMNKIFVTEDENYIVIVGTNDRVAAEKALRDAEVTWYGENHEEPQLDFEQFALCDIYRGTKDGEENTVYWGENPGSFFDANTDVEIEEGFVGTWDDIKK